MVFPRKNFKTHMLYGAPPGTLGLAAHSGWMNADLFVDVMKDFVKNTSSSKDNPSLLILHNHESHLSIQALDLAKNSGVTVLTLPPHTTAKLQPLDVGLSAPFKSFYNAAVDSWLLRNPGQMLTIYHVAECVGQAYLKAMTPINITYAFRKCGIHPFNDLIFTDDNSEIISSLYDAQENPLKHDLNCSVIDTAPQKPLYVTSIATSDTAATLQKYSNELDTPSTSRGRGAFISSSMFRPPIKAGSRKIKKRRKLGKSMIATDTPEKNQIENKKKTCTKNVKKRDIFKEKKTTTIDCDSTSTTDEEILVASGSSSAGEDFISEEEEEMILTENFVPLLREPKESEKNDIKYILPKPKVDGGSRRQVTFKFPVNISLLKFTY
ncbi:unnamed protein product [Euphydryas editha]|uniref:DDE-1 domain-containing protein n=1 Tax=Euphydryas editha TaxID=104508 RepID=A0AAU9TDX2_EUPED|nr:unnamed protein product [Euphydryas editha]